MPISPIKFEGTAEIGISDILCVCPCGNHDKSSTIEFNFRDQCVYYLCSKCKKMNKMDFSKPSLPSLPKTRM